jgi:hypothetical protein
MPSIVIPVSSISWAIDFTSVFCHAAKHPEGLLSIDMWSIILIFKLELPAQKSRVQATPNTAFPFKSKGHWQQITPDSC